MVGFALTGNILIEKYVLNSLHDLACSPEEQDFIKTRYENTAWIKSHVASTTGKCAGIVGKTKKVAREMDHRCTKIRTETPVDRIAMHPQIKNYPGAFHDCYIGTASPKETVDVFNAATAGIKAILKKGNVYALGERTGMVKLHPDHPDEE